MAVLTAMVHKEDMWYVAECPELGTVSQGPGIEEAIENLKEATELYIEEMNFVPNFKVMMTTFEAAVNA